MKLDLGKLIAYTRSLLAVALLKVEDKEICLDRILKIECLPKEERDRWIQVNTLFKHTETITKANLIKVFGFNRLDNETLDTLVNSDIDDEIDIYIGNYEKALKKVDLMSVLSDYKNRLLKCEEIDVDLLIDKLSDEATNKSISMDTLSKLESIYNEDVDKTKISTCIKKTDELNAGFRKGTVNAIMGYTGSYKTLYCTNVSYEALKSNLNVCYVSLEISKAEMYYNFLSRYSNEAMFDKPLCHTDMKFKELDEEDKDYLFHTIVPCFGQELAKHLVVIDETDFNSNSSSTFDDLFRNVERSFIESTGKGVDLVIIDHLNLLKFNDSNGMNDYSKVNHWMSYFRRNCKNFIRKHKQICILVAVQCSRDGYEKAKNNGGSYSLTGAAEGNEIERSSENVLAIYSDSGLKERLQAKLQIIKGRNCGEMKEPAVISVNPKYYIVSDYDETAEAKSDDEVVDVSKVNEVNTECNSESKTTEEIEETVENDNTNISNITLETLERMDNPMSTAKLSITPEKREVLSQLGVNIPDDVIENQNQWGAL